MKKRVRASAIALLATLCLVPALAQAPEPARGIKFPTIRQSDLKQWLTYLSSDELQGRQVFSEGYGVAAQFIAERLREFGVKPIGADGTYFQIVRLQTYKVVRNSSVTVRANGQSRTFKDGDHVTFPAASGGRQTLTFDAAEFVGAGRPTDYDGRSVSGKLAVLVAPSAGGRTGRGARSFAVQTAGAKAVVDYVPSATAPTAADQALARAQANLARATADLAAAQQEVQAERGGGADGFAISAAAGRGRGQRGPQADIGPTPQRVDLPVPPQFSGDDTFFEALFAGAPASFAELKTKLARGEDVSGFTIPGASVTISIDNTYEPVTTQLTRNVVGMVEGIDPKLKDTYVLFGAHLDHVGYATTAQNPPGVVNNPIETDRIWNGADDDGTGSTAELAIAKAFASGPKPKRSVVFIWHSGEEANLYGSRYNADFPVVPLQKVQCELNIDMIGRNRDNDPTQADTVFVIGADRISTDLHNLIVDTDATLPSPLKLDYEYNDPNDPNSFYTRSDHYSYASKGIPIAFFFTGTHPDYHANSDSVDKIIFAKQARIAQLVYETGFAAADTDKVLRRDNRGPRSGRGFSGRLTPTR